MSEARPVVVHHQQEPRGLLFERDGWWAGLVSNAAGETSGWHHHAGNDTYVHVISGSITFEFGADGAQSVSARAGDSVLVPFGTVHRERTGPDQDLEAVVIRIGGEPEQVDVDGPGTANA